MIADAMVAALSAPACFEPVEAGGAARAARMLADLI
jgi:predicted acylesterase/phospholipase RssA